MIDATAVKKLRGFFHLAQVVMMVRDDCIGFCLFAAGFVYIPGIRHTAGSGAAGIDRGINNPAVTITDMIPRLFEHGKLVLVAYVYSFLKHLTEL